MAAEKQCVTCGKKLRAGTPFATCGKHRTPEEQREAWRVAALNKRIAAGGKPRAKIEKDDDDVLDRVGVAKTPPKTDWLKRFRTVAEALGYEPDELLAKYCEGWLAAVKEGVEKLEGGGKR